LHIQVNRNWVAGRHIYILLLLVQVVGLIK
jgi:hypothetical protein